MGEGSIAVRPADPSDAAAIAGIYNEGIAERQATFETRPREPGEIGAWFERRLPFLVAVDDEGRVLGFAYVSSYSDRCVYDGVGEHGVYVAADARGHGLGRRLLDELARASEHSGLYKLTSRVFTTNPASLAAHRAAGFEEIGVQRRHGKLDGEWKDCVLVELLLGDAAQGETRRQVHLNDPQTLYRHWEESQWSPWEVDLGPDRDQWWNGMSERDRGLVHWALASLMVAEERITTKFAGLVLAADSEEEATYLASQQVDEARHMQFYARFQDEVVAEPETIAAHVARSREQLGEPFAVIFDQALVSAHERLVADPRNDEAKVDFVTTYHLIIESTLGLTAFEFITRHLREQGQLPGFVDGYTRIHHDEQRHIGYGIWFLREAAGSDPRLAERVRQTLRELLPAAATALAPPDRDGVDFDALGASPEEIRDFALGGLTRRLKIVGVPLESL